MSIAGRGITVLVVLSIAGRSVAQVHQDWPPQSLPPRLMPAAAAAKDTEHYRALDLFLRGQLLESDSRILDAVRLYEEALKVDPHAVALYRALIPLCFGLDRQNQALEYCRKALELDPQDAEVLWRYGCELGELGRREEAAATFAKALPLPAVQAEPERLLQVALALAVLQEDLKHPAGAARAYQQAAGALEQMALRAAAESPGHRQIHADLARVLERLGKTELLAQRPDQAIAAFKKAQAKDPLQSARFDYQMAEVFLAQKEPARALEHLQRYIASQPGGTNAYELLIKVLDQLGKPDQVLPTLETAVARDQFNQNLKLLLAREYEQRHQAKKAETLYLALLEDAPSEEAYRGITRMYQKQERWDDLVQRLDQDLSDPRRVAGARMQVKVLVEDLALVKGTVTAAHQRPAGSPVLALKTRRLLATLSRQARLYDLAEYFCRACLPDDPEPGEVYLELCRVLAEARKPEAEAEVCREALTKKLKVPALVFQLELARALAQGGKHNKEAIATAQQALESVRPESAEHKQAAFTLATIYYRCNQLDQAVERCEKLLSSTNDAKEQRQVRYLLASVYSAKHEYDKSEALLEKLLAADPEDAVLCNDLGYTWADRGKNLEEAEKLIRKAIALTRAEHAKRKATLEILAAEEDNAAYIDSLGWVLFKRGRLQEAREQLEYASQLPDGDDPVIHEHLGEVYLALEEHAKVGPAWLKAMELYTKSTRPGHEDRARELRKKYDQLIRKGAPHP